MLDKESMRRWVEERLAGSGLFLVDFTVTPDNDVTVEVDGGSGVDIDFCVDLSRAFEEAFPRNDEDYSLEVGSAGLTSPFKVREQYRAHRGEQVEVLAADGKKYRGELAESTDEGFTVLVPEKVKKEGEKRPVIEEVAHTFPYDEVKYTKLNIDF